MSVFIIAEIGINHNGDMGICKKLIDAAKNAGCDAVKFQKRDINHCTTKTTGIKHDIWEWVLRHTHLMV